MTYFVIAPIAFILLFTAASGTAMLHVSRFVEALFDEAECRFAQRHQRRTARARRRRDMRDVQLGTQAQNRSSAGWQHHTIA